MTDELPTSARRAFDNHDSFERATENTYRVTTTVFDGRVTASAAGNAASVYTVSVSVPSLQAATTDEVGDTVVQGWFEALELRLEDATKATRTTVELHEYTVERIDADVVVTYQFTLSDAETAAAVARTFVEYVEGTYVESVVPGYEYEGAVAGLLDQAASHGEGQAGGTPL